MGTIFIFAPFFQLPLVQPRRQALTVTVLRMIALSVSVVITSHWKVLCKELVTRGIPHVFDAVWHLGIRVCIIIFGVICIFTRIGCGHYIIDISVRGFLLLLAF